MSKLKGNTAEQPFAIPPRGWWQIALRVAGELQRDHVSLIAAGVAFYGLLALFPAITALVALGGLVLDPAEVARQIGSLSTILPQGAADIITGQATEVAGARQTGLRVAALLGTGLALYSASKGVASLIEGLNVVYGERESRGFIKTTFVKLALTLFLMVGLVAGLVATVMVPAVLGLIDLGIVTEILIRVARWGVLLVLTVLGIGVLYRFGPDRSGAQWTWLTPGAITACALWLAASVGFGVYTQNFASYNQSFGALSGVIVLLMWLWISAWVLLLGAKINAEAELQTRHDTTIGPDSPIGSRGAVKADTPPPNTPAADAADT